MWTTVQEGTEMGCFSRVCNYSRIELIERFHIVWFKLANEYFDFAQFETFLLDFHEFLLRNDNQTFEAYSQQRVLSVAEIFWIEKKEEKISQWTRYCH